MQWSSFLIGALVTAPAAAAVTLWVVRRNLIRANRLRKRTRSTEHLMELARLAGGLAHEIRNPLSVIKLNLQLLAEDFCDRDDERGQRDLARLQRLQDEVQRLHDILDEFLRYAGNMELRLRPCDLRGLIEELVDFFRPQAEHSRVVLHAALPDSPVVCGVDPALIKQALLNLMLNAIQAMGDGGELLVRLSGVDGHAVLEVIDTGAGIDPAALPRIFDAYFSSRAGGSGLGLPLTRRIIHQHDGEIQVYSEVGKGARFVVSLPLAARP